MPIIMPALPPQAHAEIRPLFGTEEVACAQGDVGKQVYLQLGEVFCHWNLQLANQPSPFFEQEIEYVAVPPNRTFTVPTRYDFRGKGTPLPYDYDLE